MKLTTEQMERIIVEVMTKQPPSLDTPEAEAFRVAVTKDIEAIVAKGGVVDIPPEIP